MENIEIKKIDALFNSRTDINKEELGSLMKDIEQRGLLQPVGVKKEGERYILRFGHRRLMACKKLGWKKIPAIVDNEEKELLELLADNVAENTHRKDLSISEFSAICLRYKDEGLSISEIAVKLGETIGKIQTALRITNKAPEEVRRYIKFMPDNNEKKNKKGKISASVANNILKLRIKNEDIKELFELAREKEFTTLQIDLIGHLLREGKKLDWIIKNMDKFIVMGINLVANRNELEKYQDRGIKLIRGFINGNYPPDKNLLV